MALFNNNTKETNNKSDRRGSDYQLQVDELQYKIMEANERLQDSKSKMIELQDRLDEYVSKERQIAEIMIHAQINAQKIEAQARAKAEILLQETDEELRRKSQEMELLQMKVQQFKQEFHDRLDQYKSSFEQIIDPIDNLDFNATLISKNERIRSHG